MFGLRKGRGWALIARLTLGALIFGALVLAMLLTREAAADHCLYVPPQDYLRAEHEEIKVFAGLGDDGLVYRLYVAGEGRSWTLVTAYPDGLFCFMAAGRVIQLGADPPSEER